MEDALGGKLLPLVLRAVVAPLTPLLQAELVSSAFLTPQPRPEEYWARLHSLVFGFKRVER